MRHAVLMLCLATGLVACGAVPVDYRGAQTLVSAETVVELDVAGQPTAVDATISVGFFVVDTDGETSTVRWCLLIDTPVGGGALPVFDGDACEDRFGAFEYRIQFPPVMETTP